MEKALAMGYDAVAMTDHGVLFGAVEFYKVAKKAGIKPIIGCEVYVAPRSRHDRTPKVDDDPHHLVLLAENETGYRNLVRLSSIAFTEGFYYKPRVDLEVLRQYSEGLIATSACLSGEIPKLLLAGRQEEAYNKAREYREIFGPDDFFLEVQDIGIADQGEVNKKIVAMSRELGIPLVATNDVHYLDMGDASLHDVLLCIQTGKSVEDTGRLKFPTNQFYFKTPQEMKKSFAGELDEALKNTVAIADRCNFDFTFGRSRVPRYPVPEGHTEESYLRELCFDGVKKRYSKVTQEIQDRLNYELDVIQKMGYCGYFLIVWDFIHFARQSGIYVGPGRGSAPGSLVAYSLGITSLDPLKYGLIFERFLNPERVSMPDIDVDFCYERRQDVIDYVTRKYGEDRVAQIITFGTMAARAAVRDVGRALALPYAEVDRIAKLVPAELNITIDKALETAPDLKVLYDSNERVRTLIDMARGVEGMPRHASVHAAGVVISDIPLMEHVPLYRGSDGVITTQYPMSDLESLGVLKMDFLGLRTLTMIGNAVKIVEATTHEKLDMSNLPLNDSKVYEMLCKGDSMGVFQLESSLFRNLLREVKPQSFEDLIAILALGRPGPMNCISDFVKQKHGEIEIKYPHPKVEPILKETYGIMLYQEQVMMVANYLAGFSMGEADLMRRAMGKKKPEVLAGLRTRFVEGSVKGGVPEKTANEIFDLMEYFAGYGFNKSHSAAYALISYQTAYLKAHYPVEFMAALLTSVSGNTDKVAFYIDECRRKGIEVLPPDVNESLTDFTVVGGGIRFGLAAVKNVGRSAVEAIIKARKEHKRFTNLMDFCEKVDTSVVTKKVTESLIRCGAFDSLGHRRSQLLAILDTAYDMAQSGRRKKNGGQASFFDLFEEKSEFASYDIPLPDIDEFPERERLAMEKELLGLYITGHPLMPVADQIRELATVTCATLPHLPDGTDVTIGGMVTAIKKITTKNGQQMAFVEVEDLYGSVEVIVFPKTYEKYSSFLSEDRVVIIQGKTDSKEEEGAKLIANEIIPLTREDVNIMLDSTELKQELLSRVRNVLEQNKGDRPVFVTVKTAEGKAVISTPPDLWVRGSADLLNMIHGLLGSRMRTAG